MNLCRYLIIMGCLLLYTTANMQANIYINELLVSNSSGITDPDFGDTADWVELYNDADVAVDISGYFISDNLNNFDKWQIPNGAEIAAKGHFILWADARDNGWHTNFKLTKAGEEIGLFDKLGNLLDSIIYQQQRTDVSFGRITDGHANWGYFETPTPNQKNNTTAWEGIVFYRPQFSLKGGLYNNSLEVALQTINGTIRYTTDGTAPNWASPIYTTPLQIDSTTILRASVFIPNYIKGKPSTQSYFINENLAERNLPVVSIATNPDYFWDADIGLYVQNFKPSWKYPINIELFEKDEGNRAAFNELAGTKVNGLNSWESPQKMLGIYFDNEYDENNISYPLFFDKRRTNFDNFILRASGSDWGFTLIRDGLTQGLAKGMMEVTTTGFRPAIVFVNGEYMGIHNIRSRLDKGFVEENLGMAATDFDLIENNGFVEEGDTIAFSELFKLLYKDLTIPSNYEEVAKVMDMENCIDFHITEIWSSNVSYGHNITFWKAKNDTAKWRWMIQDFDRGFAGSHNDLIQNFTVEYSPYTWVAQAFSNLLANQNFSDAFLSRFATHLFTTFHPQRVQEHVELKSNAIEMEVPYHVARWQGMSSDYATAIPTVEHWQKSVQDLNIFAQERYNIIYDNIMEHFPVSEKSILGIAAFPEQGGTVLMNDVPLPKNNWSAYFFNDLTFELQAKTAAGYEFQGWSEAEIEVLIPEEAVWKYIEQETFVSNNWTTLNFEDALWQQGAGQLGYGDGDENTVLPYGAVADIKPISTYFRKKFIIDNPNNYTGQLVLRLVKDDGAIIYLNGKEVTRTNMPKNEVTSDTYAISSSKEEFENNYDFYLVNTRELVAGENVIAVEIHQYDLFAGEINDDLSFDLELKALKKDTTIITTNPTLTSSIFSDKVYAANYTQISNCILPDSIQSNTMLTANCSPYLALKEVVIAPNATLTIEAGVEILFSENAGLLVHGNLMVAGNETQAVNFSPNTTAGINKWKNIYFENATSISNLNYLVLKGASYGAHSLKENAAITAWNANLNINNLTIEDVFGNPILTRYSDVILQNSQLHSKVTGDLINVKYGEALIDNCVFRGNNQVDTDAIDYDEVENGVIRNSKIYNFLGFNSDGIDLGENSRNVLIENNFIHHIADKGISVGQQSTAETTNNIIVECNQGFGIKDEAEVSVQQTTFYNNAYDIAAFEKNAGSGGGKVIAKNSIFSNTAFAPVFIDQFSDIQIANCLADTDSLLSEFVLFGNPLFENPSLNNFQLQANSPAINAGLNTFGNAINLGTSVHNYTANPSLVISAIHYHPSNIADAEFIEITNPQSIPINLDGYFFSDGIDFVFPINTTINSMEKIRIAKDVSLHYNFEGPLFEWTEGNLANNGEQLILNNSYGIIVDHVTYNSELPWPTTANGTGAYLSLKDLALDNHFAQSWQALEFVLPPVIEKPNVTLFPNPTNNILSIKTLSEELGEIILYDALGRQLLITNTVEKTIEFNLKEYNTGLYFVRVDGDFVGKIIKVE